MKKAKKIARFIREAYDMYHLVYQFFCHCYDEELDDTIEDPLVVDGALNMRAVEKSAMVLGTSVKHLIDMDYAAVMRWLKKYRYFELWSGFKFSLDCSLRQEGYREVRLLDAIFGTRNSQNVPPRYDAEDVKRRLFALLHEIDQVVPGTYHEGASIEHLEISTDNFCHFPQIDEYVRSFLEMVDRAKELFFEAWNHALTEEEIQEYNLLVSVIGIEDPNYRSQYLYYDLLRKFIPVYKEEGHTEFFDFVRIRRLMFLAPWKCAEFVQYPDLMRRFLQVYPRAQIEMRKFAMTVSKFTCWFVWSDAEPIDISPEEESEMNDFFEMVGEEPLAYENRPKKPTIIYIEKTPEEMRGDEIYAKQLQKLTGPVTLGGIEVPHNYLSQRAPSLENLQRMQRRIDALHSAGGPADA